MAYNFQLVDPATGKKKLGGPASDPGAIFVVQKYTVGAGGQQNFAVSVRAFTVNTLIKVYVNGTLMDDGDLNDYVANVDNQRIEFTFVIPENAKVRVEVY